MWSTSANAGADADGETETTRMIREMREEAYLAQLAWAGYAAAVDARAPHPSERRNRRN